MNFIQEINGKISLNGNFAFILVIATTDVSLIPGITVAGATPELTHFTPAADAEFLIKGKCISINSVPVTPTGIPTPAIISRVSLKLVNATKLVVNAGSRVKPKIPFIDVGGEPGGDIRKFSLTREISQRILENSITLGEELANSYDFLVIGESIPAGTTTAMAVLLSLGYDAADKVSSASPVNPKDLKRKVVYEAIKELPSDFLGKISKVSDPMLISVAGITIGFRKRVLLAGGTQMTAAAAIIKEIDKKIIQNISIGTTKWIIQDSSSDIVSISRQVGVPVMASLLDFSKSKYSGLRAYEEGFVKEGVGAGGSSIIALSKGFTPQDILVEIEKIYSKLI
ncbi:hypothetical protein SUSAZ_00100 [Sulfolobus acidocaldarius SUSAZ]|nr:hypothetical protein SUSAZ_00100 [Sulfolobus acidocaldarius SUSAZ]